MSNTACRQRMQAIQGDITQLEVDAIVNAANESLLGGGGVDGAIHAAAGPHLLAECRKLNGCDTGAAKITKGYRLPAKYVIHTVGPIWQDGDHGEPELLASCYRNCLDLAKENLATTVAFPCISTGIFGYPKDRACDLAVATVADWLSKHDLPTSVIFCCFGPSDLDLYQHRLGTA